MTRWPRKSGTKKAPGESLGSISAKKAPPIAGGNLWLEAMAPIEAEDLTSVAGVWEKCFGQDARNFTVIVEPSASASKDEEGSEGKRAEFKVWAPLLLGSPVVPFSLYFASRFPYKVTNPQQRVPLL